MKSDYRRAIGKILSENLNSGTPWKSNFCHVFRGYCILQAEPLMCSVWVIWHMWVLHIRVKSLAISCSVQPWRLFNIENKITLGNKLWWGLDRCITIFNGGTYTSYLGSNVGVRWIKGLLKSQSTPPFLKRAVINNQRSICWNLNTWVCTVFIILYKELQRGACFPHPQEEVANFFLPILPMWRKSVHMRDRKSVV